MPPAPHQQHTDENASPPLLGRRQDLLVPAAASDASAVADRKPRANNTDKNMSAGGDRKVEPLIVFDWDDTILTSSWIQVNELLQAGSYDDLPLDVKRDLAQLEQRCVLCVYRVCFPTLMERSWGRVRFPRKPRQLQDLSVLFSGGVMAAHSSLSHLSTTSCSKLPTSSGAVTQLPRANGECVEDGYVASDEGARKKTVAGKKFATAHHHGLCRGRRRCG